MSWRDIAKEQSRYGKAVYVRGVRGRDLHGRKITTVEQMKNGMKVFLNNEHQYRTRKVTKDRLAHALEELRLQIYPSMTFEELYTEVGKVLGHMKDLLHYDVTLRIGQFIASSQRKTSIFMQELWKELIP